MKKLDFGQNVKIHEINVRLCTILHRSLTFFTSPNFYVYAYYVIVKVAFVGLVPINKSHRTATA